MKKGTFSKFACSIVAFLCICTLNTLGQEILSDFFEREDANYVDEWSIMSRTSDVYLNGTSLTLQNYQEDYETVRIRKPEFDSTSNYEINALVELNDGGSGFGYGLVWGYVDKYNYNTFEINNYGQYRITRVEEGKKNMVKAWTAHKSLEHEQIGDDDFKLRIVKKEDLLSFYLMADDIGESLKEAVQLHNDFHQGKGIGFIVCGKQRIQAKYLEVGYID